MPKDSYNYGAYKNQPKGPNFHQKMVNAMSQASPETIKDLSSLKEDLLEKLESFGGRLPCNTLDELIDQLGGSKKVAEMTGRKGRIVRSEDGVEYQSRCYSDIALDQTNIKEKDLFMSGVKNIAIISEAASSGISLQSDRRVQNRRRRVHITLELPWSADRAIQQFGRTHRSNQVNAPEYIFLISELAGERRFASAVAKRLESLGALTHGDRRATDTRDLSVFNVDNKYSVVALTATLETILGQSRPHVPFPVDYPTFLEDVTKSLVGVGMLIQNSDRPNDVVLGKDHDSIAKFLNRILGLPVGLQNTLFNYYISVLESLTAGAKNTGQYDQGIKDLGAKGEEVNKVQTHSFLREYSTGRANTELEVFEVIKGLSFEDACKKWADLTGPKEGFYLSRQSLAGKDTAILAVCTEDDEKKMNPRKNDLYLIYRPHLGKTSPRITLEELEKKHRPIPRLEAESPWKKQYDWCLHSCLHAYWHGNCKNTALGLHCEYGLRKRKYHLLTGSVLGVWSRVEAVLIRKTSNRRMRILRVKTSAGDKTVGALIPYPAVDEVIDTLSNDAIKDEFDEEDDGPNRRARRIQGIMKWVNRIESEEEYSDESHPESQESDLGSGPLPSKLTKTEFLSDKEDLAELVPVPSKDILMEVVGLDESFHLDQLGDKVVTNNAADKLADVVDLTYDESSRDSVDTVANDVDAVANEIDELDRCMKIKDVLSRFQ